MSVKNIIAIYPGRFQPFSRHHAEAFEWLKTKFGKNTFIATSDKIDPPKSPLNFAEKKMVISKFGYGPNLVQVKNPYKAEEITAKFNPNDTAIVFMVGEKDMLEDPRFAMKPKKDGSAGYFKPYKGNEKDLEGFDRHGYLIVAPHMSFDIPGIGEMSGTNVRKALSADVRPENYKKLFTSIFGWYDEKIAEMLKDKFSNPPKIMKEGRLIIEALIKQLISEGGASGHMSYVFDLPSVKTGDDMINTFEDAVDFLQKNPVPVKIDGLNTDVRLVTLDGKQQFVMDRGSKKELDVKGLTKADLEARFGEGHGMIKIGGDVLDIFNAALPSIKPELEKLGLTKNPNLLLNIEYVSGGKSNIISYDAGKFLAIHNVLELEKTATGARKPKLIDYDKEILQALATKLNKVAEKRGYKVFGTIPAKPIKGKTISLSGVLNKNVTVPINKTQKETKSLKNWMSDLVIPKGKKIIWNGAKEDALSKKAFNAIYVGSTVESGAKDESQYQDIISGYITFLSAMMIGQEILDNLTSDIGDLKDQEGIVITGMGNTPQFKIIGKFMTKKPEEGSATFKESKILVKEGGNVFKTKDNAPATGRIDKSDVVPTVKWLEKITGMPLVKNMIGNTGITPTSGDLDIAVDEKTISKAEVESKLSTWAKENGLNPKEYVKKSGDSVHFRTPIQGKKDEFVQTDFMFGNPEWMKWSMRGSGKDSKYKGVHRHVIMASIAKSLGLKWSYKQGLVDRNTNEVITNDPDKIAKTLLGKQYTEKDLLSVESILNAIKDNPKRDEMLSDAKDTLEKVYGVTI